MATAKPKAGVKSTKPVQGVSYRIFDDILALATTIARSRKDFGAEKLQSLASATRDYAASLTDMPSMRAHVVSASDSIEGLAGYVMHTDISHMVRDAGTFARRHPLATLGLTLVAGIAASQLFRPAHSTSASKSMLRTAKKKIGKPTQRRRNGTNGAVHANA